MYAYINKENWLTGVTGKCQVKCNKMKLILKGQDNPNYDPNAIVAEEPKKPLQALGEVLQGGFDKGAQLGDYSCDTIVVSADRSIVITVLVKEASCSCNDVCANVLKYLTKPGILDNSSHTCAFVDGCTDKVVITLTPDY